MVSGTDPTIIANKLSNELESCKQWMIDKLLLHLGKTEAILLFWAPRGNSNVPVIFFLSPAMEIALQLHVPLRSNTYIYLCFLY